MSPCVDDLTLRGGRWAAAPASPGTAPSPARPGSVRALGGGLRLHAPALEPGESVGPPDFVGIGVQKAGTTWWYGLIAAHPGVSAHARIHKERHFLSRFATESFGPGEVADYHGWFPRQAGTLAGEWTPDYLDFPWVPPLLARAAPDARLLLMVRDPIERFRSGLAHHRRHRGAIIGHDGGRRRGPGLLPPGRHPWFDHIDRDQLLVLQYERCTADPAGQLARSYRFLGLDDAFVPADLRRPVGPTTEGRVPIADDAVERLVEAYQPDVEALATESRGVRTWPCGRTSPPARSRDRRRRRPDPVAARRLHSRRAHLVAIGLPIARRLGRIEGDPRLVTLVMIALFLHLLGSSATIFVDNHVYHGVADFTQYVNRGAIIAKNFRSFHFTTAGSGVRSPVGDGSVTIAAGLIFSIVGTNELATFFVFAFFSWLGTIFFYRAFCITFPEGGHRRYALMLFLLPSLLYWTSDVSKEAVMMLALGVTTLGTARVFVRHPRGYLLIVIGTAMGIFTRPDEFAILFGGFTVALFFRRQTSNQATRAIRRLGTLAFLGVVLGITAVLTAKFLHSNSGGIHSLSGILNKAHSNNGAAGLGSTNVPYSSDPLFYPPRPLLRALRPVAHHGPEPDPAHRRRREHHHPGTDPHLAAADPPGLAGRAAAGLRHPLCRLLGRLHLRLCRPGQPRPHHPGADPRVPLPPRPVGHPTADKGQPPRYPWEMRRVKRRDQRLAKAGPVVSTRRHEDTGGGHGVPWPLNSGSRLRLANTIEGLIGCGPTELFSAVSEGRTDFAPPPPSIGLARMERLAIDDRPPGPTDVARCLWHPALPFEMPVRARPVVSPALRRFAQGRYDLVWYFQVRAWVLADDPGLAPAVVDIDDLEDEKILARTALPRREGERRSPWREEAARLWAAEDVRRWRRLHRSVAGRAAASVVCSELDARRSALPGVRVLPNGYPMPDRPVGRPSVSSPPTVVFQGTLRYSPNADAARYLVEDIGPRLRALVPTIRIRLVGVAPPALAALDDPPTVTVTGQVADITDELAHCDIVIIPLRYGSGTRVKILEAFAHRIPVVSTTLGAEGLDVESRIHLLVADGPDELAAACARLIGDDALRRALVEQAHTLYMARYRSSVVQDEIGALAREVAAR